MYSEGDQRYACTTGCQTPTIDSAFPNRSHLYKNNNTEVVDRAFPSVENTISYLFNSFFSLDNSVSFDDLTEHAQNMELLVVPYLRSDITILTNDVSVLDFLKGCIYDIIFCIPGSVQLPGVQF